MPYASTGRDDLRASAPWAPASTRMLRKPGPAISALAMPSAAPSSVGQELGELAGVHAGLLGQLERDVGGVVAVLLDLGPLDEHLGRHPVGQRDRPRLAEGGEGTDDGRRKLLGSHPPRLSALLGDPRTWTTRRDALASGE